MMLKTWGQGVGPGLFLSIFALGDKVEGKDVWFDLVTGELLLKEEFVVRDGKIVVENISAARGNADEGPNVGLKWREDNS